MTDEVGLAVTEFPDAGLVAGLNASQIDGDDLAGFDKVGLTGGIKTTMEFESVWRMNMEFLYSERGSRPDIFNPEYDPDIEISESDISFCSSDAEVMSVEYTTVERTDVIE